MASGGHLLQQQKASVETRIKSLVNSDLKEICRAHNYQVSGTKANLQKRCIEILNTIVNTGDQAGFRDLNFRVNNHGQAPPPGATSAYSTGYSQSNSSHQPATSMPPRQSYTAARLPPGLKYFKGSPFYENYESVLPLMDLPDGPEMPQNRHTVRNTIALSHDMAARLKADPTLRLLLYCGTGVNQYSVVDVAFPNQLEVKINNDDVKSNFKGLKNKPGSTKPADITDKVRKTAGYQNQLAVTYALTQKRYSLTVYLVKHVSADALTERIKFGKHGGGIITKQKVLDEMHKAQLDDDIQATSVRMSLKDPISTMRITLPVRSTVCAHNQCFDGAMFMQLNEQAPQWICPICSKNVSYESLCVDKYFEEILQQTATSIEKVDVLPEGDWKVIKEDDAQPKEQSSRDNRATYDNDFSDDEIVEVPHPEPKNKRSSNGVPIGSSGTPRMFSPALGSGFAINTPPLSSRRPSAAPSTSSAQTGSKRAASAVIDLTLSDDDDQPPRPAKRQSTLASTHTGLPAPSPQPHQTAFQPLPNPPSSSYAPGQSDVTDAYRASVNASRPSSNYDRSSNAPDPYRASSFGTFAAPRASPFDASNGSSPVYPSASSFARPPWPDDWNTPPLRPTSTSTPASTAGTSGARPPPALQSFSIRPPGAASNSAQQGSSNGNPMQLPPINPYLPDGCASWRNGSYPNYSHSPPGA